jgi:hypothetical protein
MDAVEPGEAIGVGERNRVGHLAAVGGGMQIVTFVESPLKRLRKQRADGGFAGPGDSHQDEDHRRQHFSRSPLLTYLHRPYKFFGLPEWAERLLTSSSIREGQSQRLNRLDAKGAVGARRDAYGIILRTDRQNS